MAAAFSAADRAFMDHALRLGRRHLGATWPNPSVGCVIVRDGVLVGRGVTSATGRPHGETQALAHAGSAAEGATAYVTLEPCSHYGRTGPCVDALARARIARVVTAIGDPDPRVHGRGFSMLRAYGLTVETGLGEAQAALDHRGHFARIRLGRPFVQVKMAVTADGFVAGDGGGRLQISAEAANARVHLMRARADAIMVGLGTVRADDPLLTCRLPGLEHRAPVRVVMDADLSIPLASRLVATAGTVPTWIFAGVGGFEDREAALRALGCEVMRVARGPEGRPDIGDAIRLLAARGITRLMVEGGPTLVEAFRQAGLIDEAVLVRSPLVIGAGRAAFGSIPFTTGLARVDAGVFGPDIIETWR